jgi:hypothetical protein
MKVAPVAAEMVGEVPLPETGREVALPATPLPKNVSARATRAEVN